MNYMKFSIEIFDAQPGPYLQGPKGQ